MLKSFVKTVQSPFLTHTRTYTHINGYHLIDRSRHGVTTRTYNVILIKINYFLFTNSLGHHPESTIYFDFCFFILCYFLLFSLFVPNSVKESHLSQRKTGTDRGRKGDGGFSVWNLLGKELEL